MKKLLFFAFAIGICNNAFAVKVYGTQTSKEGCKVVIDGDVNIFTGVFTGTTTISGPNPPCVNGTLNWSLMAPENNVTIKFNNKSKSKVTNITFNSTNPNNLSMIKILSERKVLQEIIKNFNREIKAEKAKTK